MRHAVMTPFCYSIPVFFAFRQPSMPHARHSRLAALLSGILLLFGLLVTGNATAAKHDGASAGDHDVLQFDDSMLEEELVYPDWFKLSSGDLREDFKQARAAGKKLITYFGQKRCAYCEQFMKTSLADPDIVNYLRRHYDVIAFDIWGIDDIIDTDGTAYDTERQLSIHYRTNFTPSLVFYDENGKPVFRLRGFYPPYKFRAALKYVNEGFYKKETFKQYLARAVQGEFFLEGGLNERDFFSKPPYDLPALLQDGKPLVVFFEQGNCHACDLLHTGPLDKKVTLKEIRKMHAVQLNMWKDTPVITPTGEKTTARKWAEALNIFYAPSLVFFSPEGREVIRLDSVTQFYRLWGVLDYVNRKGYEHTGDYQSWRLQQRKISH